MVFKLKIDYKINPNNYYIFWILTFFLYFIYPSFSLIENSNHYISTKLNNGNFFIITDKGVFIYDPTLTIEINKTVISELNTFLNMGYQIKHFNEHEGGYLLLFT